MDNWGDDVFESIERFEEEEALAAESARTAIAGCHVSPDGELDVVYQEDEGQYAARMVTLQRRLAMTEGGAFNFKRAYIRYAHGGNVIELKTPEVSAAPGHHGGSGKILDFSQKSRMRLLKWLNSIDREAMDVSRLWMLTLTYPSSWLNDPRAWKRHLKAFQERVRRAYGPLAAVWKLEPQRRGAPHFHLIIYVPREWTVGLEHCGSKWHGQRLVRQWRGGELSKFRKWASQAWYEVVESGDEKHLAAGTNVEPLISWNRLISYAAKYLGKACSWVVADENGEAQSLGRFWGVWNRDAWPIRWVSLPIPLEAWVKIKRVLVQYGERVVGHVHGALKETVRSISVFMPSELVRRLYLWAFPAGAHLHEAPADVRRLMLECGIEAIPGDAGRMRWLSNQGLRSVAEGESDVLRERVASAA